LIEGMATEWDASQHHDEYREVLMKLIDKKIKSGKTEAIDVEEIDEDEAEVQTINFMDVLKKSVASAGSKTKKRPPATKKKSAPRKKKSMPRKTTAKKRRTG
jgi:DNA end-binding protein Ku